jgi:DNA polymerase-3 subunit delta'
MAKRTAKKAPARERRDQPDPLQPSHHPAPVPLRGILGQDRALRQLTAAIDAGRLHHAWVFHGPTGVGKLTTALAFAALVLDPTTRHTAQGLAPDPDSRVAALLAGGAHPDLHVITKELARFSDDKSVRDAKLTTIPKDVIERHLLGPAARMARLGAGGLASKVFIVDQAELLDRSATNAPTQNALLKTLEEPPPGTLIILVTSAEDRLLPTIRSRCQLVRFAPLAEPDMQAWLDTTDLTPAQRQWALAHAHGSPGQAIEAVRTGQDRWRERIEPMLEQLLAGAFPLDLGPQMHGLVNDWATARADEDKNASKEAANRAASERMLALVAELLAAKLPACAHAQAEDMARRIDAVSAASRRLAANVNMQMVFDALAAELAHPTPGLI